MAHPFPPEGPWTSPRSPGLSIQFMPLRTLEALADGDLARASSSAPALPPLPPFLISEANRGIWHRRLTSLAEDPGAIPWSSRVIIYEGSGLGASNPPAPIIVGRMGFHGTPDARGMVEVGYEIDEAHRRQGYARSAMRIMIDVAKAVEGVNVIRASVAEPNWRSRRVVESEELRKVGKEKHERRGWEEIFEMDLHSKEDGKLDKLD